MIWEITDNKKPKIGGKRYRNKFALIPTKVISEHTHPSGFKEIKTYIIWLQHYTQVYEYQSNAYYSSWDWKWCNDWVKVKKLIT